MGFNYLQTDDRDDYFKQFGSNSIKVKKDKWYTLIDKNGVVLFENVPRHKPKNYSRKYWIKGKTGEKWKWQQYLKNNGYTLKISNPS